MDPDLANLKSQIRIRIKIMGDSILKKITYGEESAVGDDLVDGGGQSETITKPNL
jgi:hypothetical protein